MTWGSGDKFVEISCKALSLLLPPSALPGTFPRKREKEARGEAVQHRHPLPLAGEGDQRSWWRGEQHALRQGMVRSR